MKKLFALMLALTFCLCNSFSAVAFVTESYEPEITVPEKPPKHVGTTPLFEAVNLFEEISEEQTDISNQIYENILKQNPDLFIYTNEGVERLNGWDTMTDAELYEVKIFSNTLLEDCTTADEKISAAARYVATNVGYDLDYYYDGEYEYEEINHSAYDVLANKSAVCYGYSTAASALLQLAGVPCAIIMSPGHAWNMAYNGERWILFDTTWMSNCTYKDGELSQSDIINEEWFDYTIDFANSDYNHLIEEADYTEYDNTLVTFPIYTTKEEFTIPENITKIGRLAFGGCDSLNITFNGVLSEVGEYAFFECYGLSGDVSIEDAESIEDKAFYRCENANIIFGDDLEHIGEHAFTECFGITGEVNLEDLKTVGAYAFYDCQSAHITFGHDLEYIGEYAFCDCFGITGEVDLEDLKAVGAYAFYACQSAQIVFGDDLEQVGDFAFYDCFGITGEVNLKKLKSVGTGAFFDCQSAQIILGENLEHVGDSAFYDCFGMTGEINLENLKTVGNYSFSGCKNAQIIFGDKLETVGDSAFEECESAKGVLNLKNIKSLGQYAFSDCSSITGIIIGPGIDTIPKAAFQLCSSVKDIIIPKSIKTIANNAFLLIEHDWYVNVYYYGSEEEWNAIVADHDSNLWIYEISKMEYNYKPHMEAPKISLNGGSVTVTYSGIPLGEMVYFAEYKDGKFLGIRSKLLDKTNSFDLENENADKVSFFIMKDSSSLLPHTAPAWVNLDN